MSDDALEQSARTVETTINYVSPGSFVNRRFVAPGIEHNTGHYETRPVLVRDGRPIKSHFMLDTHGFVLATDSSTVRDFFNKDEVARVYPTEVADTVKRLTGAAKVIVRGWMVRTAGDVARHQSKDVAGYKHQGGVQPPAGEAHVDFTQKSAERLAASTYKDNFPDGPGYSRFLSSSLWRAFSVPPHDIPLAVCDSRSVAPDEGTPNTLWVVDRLPDPAAMIGPLPGEDTVPAASIFHYSARHRWWYFSGMTREEVLLIKFYDSDKSRAWRTPHTAFHDPSFVATEPRTSIEVRTIAYFE